MVLQANQAKDDEGRRVLSNRRTEISGWCSSRFKSCNHGALRPKRKRIMSTKAEARQDGVNVVILGSTVEHLDAFKGWLL